MLRVEVIPLGLFTRMQIMLQAAALQLIKILRIYLRASQLTSHMLMSLRQEITSTRNK